MTVSRTSRRSLAASALAAGVGMAVALGLSACSAGQITQTATQVAPVPGSNITVGDVALRNMLVAYKPGGYPAGANAPLEIRIFNTGTKTVRLVGVTAPGAATSVTLMGGPTPTVSPLPTTTPPPSPTAGATGSPTATGTASPTGTPTPTSAPTTAAAPGQSQISIEIPPQSYVLLVPSSGTYLQLNGLTKELQPGLSTNVEFTFDNGAKIPAEIPFAPPANPAPRATPVIGDEGEEGH